MQTSFAYMSLLLAAATAAPLQLQSRDISQDVFNNLVLYSQWSAAAYCVNNNNASGTAITCPTGNCPLVQATNAVATMEFQHTAVLDDTGFLGVDHTNGQIVLSFRGSQSIENFIDDAMVPMVPWGLCGGCLVHSGFYAAWVDIEDDVMSALNSAHSANPSYSVIVTGHSLGGALAAVAVAAIRSSGISAAMYSYGQPRVGNVALSAFISNQPGGNYRVTHTDDPVPNLPPATPPPAFDPFNIPDLGYVHLTPEYHITQGEDDITPSKVVESSNILSDVDVTGLDIDAHINYFGQIAACGPGLFTSRR